MKSSRFSKEFLNESKVAFRAEMEKVWEDDRHNMVEWCMKEHTPYLLSNGMIISMNKPKIETMFCFGYHTDYSGHECSDAEAARSAFLKSTNEFMERNLRWMDNNIETIKTSDKLFIMKYYDKSDKVVSFRTEEYFRAFPWDKDKAVEMSDEDKKTLLAIYEEERDKFKKRLESYVKRFGTSKLKTWTYWLDE